MGVVIRDHSKELKDEMQNQLVKALRSGGRGVRENALPC